MADGIYIALTGAVAQQQALDSAAHNVANANTTGFRGDQLAFAEVLRGAQAAQRAGTGQAALRQPNAYVRVDQTALDTEEGVLKQTGNPLDLALTGDGYFVLRTPQGDRLSRAGSFRLDAQGRLSNAEGMLVVADNGEPVALPRGASNIAVTAEGSIQLDGAELSKLALRTVANPAALSREGATLYKPAPDAPLLAARQVTVTQGYLESSNVSAFEGLEEIGDISATFSALMKVIEQFEQTDTRTARELGSRTA